VIALLGASLPAQEPDLAEAGYEVASASALAGAYQHGRLDHRESLQKELAARGLKLLEHDALQGGHGGPLGHGDPEGYSQLGHVGVLSWLTSGRYVPLCFRCGISFGTGGQATLTSGSSRFRSHRGQEYGWGLTA